MATVAIIGGGISGLSCAYYLKTLGQFKVKYLFLLEKSPKFGGWMKTTKFSDGAIFEHGPRSLRVTTTAGKSALVLAEELGLANRILPVKRDHATAKTNYVLAGGEMHPLPKGFFSFLRTMPPFSKPLMRHIIHELKAPKKEIEDESVYNFAKRRVGKDVADFLVDPFCRGIAAGDARQLSVRSLFPALYDAEQQHGSIMKGLAMNRSSSEDFSSNFRSSALLSKAISESWRMWSLKNGMTELVDTLACAIEEKGVADLHFNAECTDVTFKDDKAVLTVDGDKIEVDHVFSCIPSQNLSAVLNNHHPLNEMLSLIPSVDVAVVYLEYEHNVLKKEGFGMLAPSSEDSQVLGITFDSCCFPELNGNNKTRITCMIGGMWFRQILGNPKNVSKDYVLRVATDEVKKHLKVDDAPVRSKVLIHKSCIPQYVVGHFQKLKAFENEIVTNDLCLTLLGASYKGIGVPDCIYNSKVAVQKYLGLEY